MDLGALEGRRFGPHPFHVSFGNVADFVEATDGDAARWAPVAPPGFVAAALFVVAPDLLNQLTDQAVIHGEQTFEWLRPIEVSDELWISGTVSKVRERGGVYFVTFDLEVEGATGVLATGSSRFLISGAAPPASGTHGRVEPAPHDRGNPSGGQVSASRADLIRYAAATRDWNPVHWDHESAVAAGLPGVVVHGLLQASWAFNAALELREGDLPLKSARVRFRSPLVAGHPVDVSAESEDGVVSVSLRDADVEYMAARIELAEE